MTKPTLILCAAITVLTVRSVEAHEEIFTTILNGPNENPVNPSLGTGIARVTFDFDLVMMRVEASFSGLSSPTTMAHIHCCEAPPTNSMVATILPSFTGFPLGVTAGSMDTTFDMTLASNYNPDFITAKGGLSGALNALALGLENGQAYFNIHTNGSPGGEIRGHFQLVPEPGVKLMWATAMLGLILRMRKRWPAY